MIDASIYRVDGACLLRHEPGARKVTVRLPVNGGDHTLVQVNQEGFRGDELSRPAADLRVVVYGDSFISAEATALDQTFPEQLEARLADALAAWISAPSKPA